MTKKPLSSPIVRVAGHTASQKRWEYLDANWLPSTILYGDWLNFFGRDGWELASIEHTRHVFKRPV